MDKYYTIGEKTIVDGEIRYYPAGTMQGFVYKDSKAFETGEGVCYIPEYGFEVDGVDKDYLTQEQALLNGETRETIRQQCIDILGDDENMEDVFDTVDWQHVNSLLQGMDA